MPGETMDIGHAAARAWQQDWSSQFPGKHVVLVSKSVKSESGMTQAQEYEMEGYKYECESRHPDLLVYSIDRRIKDARDREAKELGGSPTADIYGEATPMSREPQQPKTISQMAAEYGTLNDAPYTESGTFVEADEQ